MVFPPEHDMLWQFTTLRTKFELSRQLITGLPSVPIAIDVWAPTIPVLSTVVMVFPTLHCVLPFDMVLSSVEFNGDMYGSTNDDKPSQISGHYKDVIRHLKKVHDKDSFIMEVELFNEDNFGYLKEEYNDKSLFCEEKIKKFENYQKLIRAYNTDWQSDYTFWKNCSGKDLVMIDRDKNKLQFANGDILTFNFGSYIELFTARESIEEIMSYFNLE